MIDLILVSPNEKYEASCLAALEEFKRESSGSLQWYYNIKATFQEFVSDLLDRKLVAGGAMVPETVFWGVIGNEFVGRISIRHELTEYLAKVGGHIGYEVRPSYRGQGIGTKLLELALPQAKNLGLEKALLTCDEINLASIKIIESNGGVFTKAIDMGEGNPMKNHYWIELS